jgi:hypothetical protein
VASLLLLLLLLGLAGFATPLLPAGLDCLYAFAAAMRAISASLPPAAAAVPLLPAASGVLTATET